MSHFAQLVRRNVAQAAQAGTLARNMPKILSGPVGLAYLEAGSQALQHLTQSNGACHEDPRCQKVWEILAVAHDSRTPGDVRTALTQLQTLLRRLTEEDSDVGGDEDIQTFRRRLNRLLD